MAAALAALPERQREAIVLQYYQELSNIDAAALMNISVRVTISLTAAGSLLPIRASSSTSGSVSFNRAILGPGAKSQVSADPMPFTPVPVGTA